MSEALLLVAVGAGMLAAVNPCGFALLPAYVGLLLSGTESLSRPAAAGRAAVLSLAMTSGFAGVFGVFGLVISPVAGQLQRHLPWFTVGLGVTLALMGLGLAAGRTLTLPRLGRSSTARPLTRSYWSMAAFGASYAVASISCTIAPFLPVVVGGFRSGSVLEGLTLFVAYAAGMGLGALLAAAGAYVAYYGWWELRVLAGDDPADPIIEAAADLQQLLAGTVDSVGPLGWAPAALALVIVVLGVRRRSRVPSSARDEAAIISET